MKLFYIFKCPLGAPDCKIGITGSWWSRLSSYQNSYSKKKHTACFDMVYIGPARAIGRLETTIKERYDWAIESDKGGESEWVSNHTVEDIEQIVDGLIIGFKFKIAKVDQQWLPLSKNNLADFLLSHEIS